MDNNTEINVSLSRSEVQKALEKCLLPEHKIISECVMELLENEDSLAVLYKASVGILVNQEYENGAEVIVNSYALESWHFNKPAMLKEGLISDDDTIEVNIQSYSKFKIKPYSVTYQFISDNVKEGIQQRTTSIKASSIERLSDNLISD